MTLGMLPTWMSSCLDEMIRHASGWRRFLHELRIIAFPSDCESSVDTIDGMGFGCVDR